MLSLRNTLLRTLPVPVRYTSTAVLTPRKEITDENSDLNVGPRLRKLRSQPVKQFSEFLTDKFGRHHNYLRISITERCNLRCRYCMPENGVQLQPDEKLLSTDEIIRLARLFASQGVHKIRLTGGEPTVRKDVIDIVKRLHEIPGIDEICMTSNGLALHRKLPALFANGLTALNLSLDTMINGSFGLRRHARCYSTSSKSSPKLSHLTGNGEAFMVDVHQKNITHRTAITRGTIRFSNPIAIQLIKTNSNKKGDVIAIARVAGIMAAKKTSELIPLCHPLSITKVLVALKVDDSGNKIDAECTVECDGKTGVEMEALTGLQVTLLTVYDMCKAVDKKMVIDNCRLARKTGGKSGNWILED